MNEILVGNSLMFWYFLLLETPASHAHGIGALEQSLINSGHG